MARLMKKRSAKAGLPPGSLVYVGDRREHDTRISVIDYEEQHVEERDIATIDGSCPTTTATSDSGRQRSSDALNSAMPASSTSPMDSGRSNGRIVADMLTSGCVGNVADRRCWQTRRPGPDTDCRGPPIDR